MYEETHVDLERHDNDPRLIYRLQIALAFIRARSEATFYKLIKLCDRKGVLIPSWRSDPDEIDRLVVIQAWEWCGEPAEFVMFH